MKLYNIKNKNRGMSLLELLIYIAILAGLMVLISNAFFSISRGRGQSQARSEVNAAIRFSSEKMRQDLKGATLLSSPILGTASSTLTMTTGGVVITYDTSAGQLRRKEGVATPTAMTGTSITVDTPTFKRLENYNASLNATTTAVQVFMTMRYNSPSKDWLYSDSVRTTITLR